MEEKGKTHFSEALLSQIRLVVDDHPLRLTDPTSRSRTDTLSMACLLL
jgi:hypothetical protein